MPSIANQDFKIYGLLDAKLSLGIRGEYCGELYAALARYVSSSDLNVADGFVFVASSDGFVRQVAPGVYYDYEAKEWKKISAVHTPAYYDALWAIQQAYFAFDGSIDWEGYKFGIGVDGSFREYEYIDAPIRNEDGYLIKGTAAYGKLASLYLGEKVEHPEGYAVVRLESLLPLVGELPLGTTEIW